MQADHRNEKYIQLSNCMLTKSTITLHADRQRIRAQFVRLTLDEYACQPCTFHAEQKIDWSRGGKSSGKTPPKTSHDQTKEQNSQISQTDNDRSLNLSGK